MQQSVITRETLVRKVLELSKRVSCQGFVIDLPGNLYTANGATMLSLELVKGASDACPAVPLKAASAVVLILLDTAQTAKGNKKNLLRLAINSLEIAYVMLSHYHDTGTGEWKSEIPKDHVETIFRFVEQVYSVYLTAEVLRNRPWFKRFFSAKLDVDTIKELRETLDHARHVFEFGALLETNRDARELRQILPTIVSPSPSRDLLNSEVTSEFTDSLSPQPPLHPVSQPPPAPSTPPDIRAKTAESFSYPPFQFSGSGPSSYISVGGDYSMVDGSVHNKHYNSGNRWNFEVKNSFSGDGFGVV